MQPTPPDGARVIFGPYKIDPGRKTIMRSVTGFVQAEAPHIKQSELCASCHTLITQAFGPNGEVIGSLPEQMNYQEWQHSDFKREQRSCQSCHMPTAPGPMRIASVLGDTRDSAGAPPVRRRQRLHGADAQPLSHRAGRRGAARGARGDRQADDSSAAGGDRHAARSSPPACRGGELAFDVDVRNLTGHKFPTGYPSRRTWLHVTVRDAQGRDGLRIGRGQRDRRDSRATTTTPIALTFEPHYEEITSADQVQIYEPILGDPQRRADDRTAHGDAVPQGQPAAAARIRQDDRGAADRRLRRGQERPGLHRRRRSRALPRAVPGGGLTAWRSSCATSRSATAGRTTSRRSRRSSRRGFCRTTPRRQTARRSSSHRQPPRSNRGHRDLDTLRGKTP